MCGNGVDLLGNGLFLHSAMAQKASALSSVPGFV